MKHTEDIIIKLLQIREARKLAESNTLSDDDVQKLRELIIENRRQIPSFALSHFDRLEATGKIGLAQVTDGKCSACGADIDNDEIEYLNKNRNIGVCDNCFAFIYMPDSKFDVDAFFKDFLSK
jgi:putative zinc ribbon domain